MNDKKSDLLLGHFKTCKTNVSLSHLCINSLHLTTITIAQLAKPISNPLTVTFSSHNWQIKDGNSGCNWVLCNRKTRMTNEHTTKGFNTNFIKRIIFSVHSDLIKSNLILCFASLASIPHQFIGVLELGQFSKTVKFFNSAELCVLNITYA